MEKSRWIQELYLGSLYLDIFVGIQANVYASFLFFVYTNDSILYTVLCFLFCSLNNVSISIYSFLILLNDCIVFHCVDIPPII